MVKKKELSDFEHGKVIALDEDGNSKFGKTTTVFIISWQNTKKLGVVTVAAQSGRPKNWQNVISITSRQFLPKTDVTSSKNGRKF